MERDTCQAESCDNCLVRFRGMFAEANPETLAECETHRQPRIFPRGSVLHYQGLTPGGVYCIRAGRVRIFKTCSRGNTQVLGWAGEGDILGEIAIYAGRPYGATAEAATEVEACFFSAKAISTIFESDGKVAAQLVRKLSVELLDLQDRLMNVVHRPVKERLAEFLLQQDVDPFQVSRREIAQLLGTTPETLARVLTEFHNDGLIERSRNRIKVVSSQRLQEVMTI